MAPRHTVYQAFSTPRHTRSHISPSGPSDQLADPANHSRRISSTELQQFTAFSCTVAPCARLHYSTSQSLSLPIYGRLKPPHHHRKVSNLLQSKTPAVFSVFTSLSGRKKGTIFVGHRSFKSSILTYQPSTTVKTTTIRILDIRSTRIDHRLDRNLAAANSNRAWATRAASGISVNFGEIQGYFIILPIQWHSDNCLGFLLVFLIFFYIYKCL